MNRIIKSGGIFLASAFVIGAAGQWIVENTYFSDDESMKAIAYASSAPSVTSAFGEVLDIKVARRLSFSNIAAQDRRKHEFVLSVSGRLAYWTVTVRDEAPGSGSNYAIHEIDAKPRK